ncbi:class II fructose-bisphosphate aldolase [Halarchaeum salinum]|uniref:Class II fructose-bisphosphate aldolase n=1 Tax=Halarchaeum salinum TaxID=489912 RepID=A0AAV3S822_9EURY
MPYYDGVELSSTYADASERGYGFFASNVTHVDVLLGLLQGADSADSDLVVQVNRKIAAAFGNGDATVGLNAFAAYIERVADSVDVGVFCNVDHVHLPNQADFLDAVAESGVPSSVMVDASDTSFEENVELTREAVERLDEADGEMLVEAELGRVAGVEGDVETATEDAFYTDPERAVEFVERTGCDLLAISVGTQHGVASGQDLDIRPDVARAVRDALDDAGFDVPLVVHGSSGLTDEQVRAFVDAGVRKFNKNTRYQYEFARTLADFYRDHADAVRPPEGVVDDRADFFGDADWSPDRTYFHPQAAAEAVQDRIAAVYGGLADLTGSAGRSRHGRR